MKALRYQETDASRWDEFCEGCSAATFLHTRRFLAYHRDRFEDESLLLVDEKGRWLGVLPGARDPEDSGRIISHPGSTYGGLMHQGRLKGEAMVQAIETVQRYYGAQGFRELVLKLVPHIYHQKPAQDDIYALTRLGAERVRCDLSSAIDLTAGIELTTRRKRSLKKASAAGLTVSSDAAQVSALWSLISANLRKHDAVPTHSCAELAELVALFPDHISVLVASLDEEPVAGLVLFHSARVAHAQYIASSALGNRVSALDLLVNLAVEQAERRGARYFDFGISTERQGRDLNESLYRFKSEFGGGGIAHEFYRLNGVNR